MPTDIAAQNGYGHGAPADKNDALVHLAGGIAHELNNIFTAVIGNLAFLDEALADASQPAELVREVMRTAERGIALSARLQAFAGRQPMRRQFVDVNGAIGDTACRLRAALPCTIKLRLTLANRECQVYVDREKFSAVLDELAQNARAAMDETGVLSIETRILGEPAEEADALGGPLLPGEYVQVVVSDTGRGMGTEAVANATDPLFTTKAPNINAGWGLSGVAGFVRQSGGRMTLHSRLGSGTRVALHFPLVRAGT